MATERILADILAKAQRQCPDKDVSVAEIAACDPQIIAAYETRQRVKVRNVKYDHERTGIVSRTTGWRPALLLMHRSNDSGSSDVLGSDDKIVAVWDGRKYVERDRIY